MGGITEDFAQEAAFEPVFRSQNIVMLHCMVQATWDQLYTLSYICNIGSFLLVQLNVKDSVCTAMSIVLYWLLQGFSKVI